MKNDPFGFQFWLGWIFWFASALILAALFWTTVLTWCFGKIQGMELTLTWAVAVFGSWFILLIPFMRKKEQIWKRLNQDQEKAVDAWLTAMGIFIGLLVASSIGWSFVFRKNFSSRGLNINWAKAVFGTWLSLLLPFLIWMYRKADLIFKSAVIRQNRVSPRFKTTFIEKSKRMLPQEIVEKVKSMPPVIEKGHVLTLVLKDGAKIPDVFVLNSSEILGVYDRQEMGMDCQNIIDVEPATWDELSRYEESKWLRLDGRA